MIKIMIKKILLSFLIVLISCISVSGEVYDISGLWHIDGEGFAKDSSSGIKLRGKIGTSMNIYTQPLSEVSQDIIDAENYSEDIKCLTGYDVHLRIDLSMFKINAWEQDIPSGIRTPIPLPEIRPTLNEPFYLFSFSIDNEEQNMNYALYLTSIYSGIIKINGVIRDLDVVGDVEIDSESAVWLDGTEKPETEEGSGCNSGMNMLMLLLMILGVKKIVRN